MARITGGFLHLRAVACAVALMGLLMTSAIACSSDVTVRRTPTVNSGVTVPDEISSLDAREVDRRLGRLFGDNTDPVGSSAPGVAPTETVVDPSIKDILDALSGGNTSAPPSEVLITISEMTLNSLANPRVTIKTPPTAGAAVVTEQNQIIYTPDGTSQGGDSFEYELFDGEVSIIAVSVEIK